MELGPPVLAVFVSKSNWPLHRHGFFCAINAAISKSSHWSVSSDPEVLHNASILSNSSAVKRLISASGIGGSEKYREVCKKLGTSRPSLGGRGALRGMPERWPQPLQISPKVRIPSPS